MKKIISLALAAITASALALTACGEEENSGKIEGNYTAVSQTQLESQLSTINDDTVLGGGDKDELGVKLALDLGLDMQEGGVKGKAEANFSYDLYVNGLQAMKDSAANDFEELPDVTVLGSGKANIDVNIPGALIAPDQKDIILKAEGKLYNDTEYAYMDYSYKMNNIDSSSKVKISFDVLIGILEGLGDPSYPDIPELPSAPQTTAAEDTEPDNGDNENVPPLEEPEETPTFKDIILQAQAVGCTVETDASKGLKIKITAPADTIKEAILGALAEQNPMYAALISFPTCTCELYVQIDENGVMTKAAFNIDLGLKIDATKETYAATVNMYVKGSVELNDNKVTLPAEIKDYTDLNVPAPM